MSNEYQEGRFQPRCPRGPRDKHYGGRSEGEAVEEESLEITRLELTEGKNAQTNNQTTIVRTYAKFIEYWTHA